MKRLWKGCLGLALGLAAQRAYAQDTEWRPVTAPAAASSSAGIGVSLRPPEPAPLPDPGQFSVVQPVTFEQVEKAQPIVRAQAPDPFLGGPNFAPAPPPPPPPPPPPGAAGGPGDERFNCGVKAYC